MVKEEKVFYGSGDGIKLCGVFNLAANSKAFAVMAHGITMDKNEWNNLHFRISKDLNDNDISTFRFDYRGHGESDGKMRDMTVIGEYLDVKKSIDEVCTRWKSKISLIASSFGAASSIIYTSLFPEKVNCVVLLNPVLDFQATFLDPTPELDWAKHSFTEKGFKSLEKYGYLLLDEQHQLDAKLLAEFQVIKPFEILKTVKCPVLTIHGDDDSMVPYKVSKKYGCPNKKSKFLTIRNADHGFVDVDDDDGNSKQSMNNQKKVTEYIINWISKWAM